MKSRHHKNISLLQQKIRYNPFEHHRSHSFNKHHNRNISNLHSNFITPENYVSQEITLPVSTELNRQGKHSKKTPAKESSQLIIKNKKNVKSKDKQSNSRKKSKNDGEKLKKSNEHIQKSTKRGSKQIIRNKKSLDHVKYEPTRQRRNGNSNELKNLSRDKLSKKDKIMNEKQKNQGKKRLKQEEIGVNWQQIVDQLGDILTKSEVTQIKEYKWIYFLGKIKDRVKLPTNKNNQPLSAREHYREPSHSNSAQKIHVYNHLTERLQDQDSSKRLESEEQFYKYEIGDHIAYRYEIIESINQGSFGQVIRVYDHKLKEQLALKIVKKCQQLVQQTFLEISILTQIKEKDKANLSGVVRIKDFTIFRNHICIVFELLDGNLYELLAANNYNGLSEEVIRIFAVQILNSLNFLQRERIVHCDIKPQNIVMKTWGKSGVKLVDFGTSCYDGKQMFQYLQSRYYRAPEVMLRKRYSFPIDMWSFGCLMAELKIGQPIFAGATNVEQLVYIINSIGFPKTQDGEYSQEFLKSAEFKQIIQKDYLSDYKSFQQNKKQTLSQHQFFSKCKYAKTCMKTLKERLQNTNKSNKQDRNFYSFLSKILMWQPQKRLKPQQALQHSWIMKGLPTQIKQLYTIFNSAQYTKQSKPSSKQSKKPDSKNKSATKKGKERVKMKQCFGERKKQTKSNEWKGKQSNCDVKIHKINPKGNNLGISCR